MFRGELIVKMLLSDDTTNTIQAFMPIRDPEDDDEVANQVIDFVMANIEESGDVVSGVAVLGIEEAGVTFEFGYSIKEDGEWETQVRH